MGLRGLMRFCRPSVCIDPDSIQTQMLIDSEFYERLMDYKPGDDALVAPITKVKTKKNKKPVLPLKRNGLVFDPQSSQDRLLINSASQNCDPDCPQNSQEAKLVQQLHEVQDRYNSIYIRITIIC
jgi:hypothetical protein